MVFENKIRKVIKRDGSIVDFNQSKITKAIFGAASSIRGTDWEKATGLSETVTKNLNSTFGTSHPNVEEIQDIIEHLLRVEGHIRTADAFLIYRAGRKKVREGILSEEEFTPDGIPRKKLEYIDNWNKKNEANTLSKLNEKVKNGKFNDLIKLSIAEYEKDIAEAAKKVLDRKGVKLIIVAGPSSSGKTTTTVKLGEHLAKKGYKLKPFHVDNYFHSLDEYEQDEFGDTDYETPYALRLGLINQHLKELLDGKDIMMPKYDFKKGLRIDNHTKFSIADDEIILVDSLHGLFPDMTSSISPDKKFKLYIETLSYVDDDDGKHIRWTDIRLLRRMLRDRDHRNHSPKATLEHWHYVRSSELQHIVPFINSVDHIVNGSLAFELPVLKKHIGKDFPNLDEYKDNPKRIDVYLRGMRVKKMLEQVEVLEDTSIIPDDCHIREFIGGSRYDVHN